MLTLRKRAEPVKAPDAVDLLRECHDRIRRFTRMAEWLADAGDAPHTAVKETAEAVLRYFTEALPRHSADEEQSIAPRLLATRAPIELREAVAAMTRQHEPIEQTLAALAPLWRQVAATPASLPACAAQMERHVNQLKALWDPHLHLEETLIFPAIRARLSPAALEEILKEMRARRS
jgi:iron-sulfur cluster repair protein YtfE (RIC family)